MPLFKNYLNLYRHFYANYSAVRAPRPSRKELFMRPESFEVDKKIVEGLNSKSIKHRSHPGQVQVKAIRPPLNFEVALLNSSTGIAIDMLKKPAVDLNNYLNQRRLPFPETFIRSKSNEIRRQIVEEMIDECRRKKFGQTDEEIDEYIEASEKLIERTVRKRIKMMTYQWEEIDYHSPAKCFTYALARFAPEFAVLRRIFDEIRRGDVDFRPKNVFDFGSGVGTTMWAIHNSWPNSVKEFFCVDTSSTMNDLLNILLHNGDLQGPPLFESKVYSRRFLSATAERQFDIVVSAFSLLEIPSYEERLRTVVNLWEKTKDFLILVENGNRYGFTTLMEARDYILAGGREVWRKKIKKMFEENELDASIVQPTLTSKELTESEKFELLSKNFSDKGIKIPTLFPTGHVFAPCPHEFGCPKMLDVLPCKFEQNYYQLELMDSKQERRQQLFSYVVLRKGERRVDDVRWPRIINPISKVQRHVRCDLCTSEGILGEILVTKNKNGRHAYRLARESEWGDSLPIEIKFVDGKAEETNLVDVNAQETEGDDEAHADVDGEAHEGDDEEHHEGNFDIEKK